MKKVTEQRMAIAKNIPYVQASLVTSERQRE